MQYFHSADPNHALFLTLGHEIGLQLGSEAPIENQASDSSDILNRFMSTSSVQGR